jgi:hypothetical protein
MYFSVVDQDAANKFALDFGLLRFRPQIPRPILPSYQGSVGELSCNIDPVILGDSGDWYANLQIQCKASDRTLNNFSSEAWPPQTEQIRVSLHMDADWRITEPIIQMVLDTMDGGFNVSVQFKAMCSLCTSTDGLILASASISILDR